MKWINWLVAIVAVSVLAVSCEQTNKDSGTTTPKPAKVEISPSKLDQISANGGSIKINLTANRDWKVTGVPQWLTVSPDSGASSLYKQEIVITAEENKGGVREAVLKFTAEDASKEVKISQGHSFGAGAPENAIFYEALETNMGSFTLNEVEVPQGLSAVWQHTTQYKCMKATAYFNNTNYASESWLISPEIDLAGYADAYFTFEHAGQYFGDITQEATVWISKDGGEWTQLLIDPDDYPASWTFMSAGEWDLSAYIGSKVKFGFKYSSTANKAGTWEVNKVAVIAGKSSRAPLEDVDPAKTQWMELPATDNSSYSYFSHRFKMDDKVYRNYSFAWSQKDLVSVWVAYPLSKPYLQKNVDRQDTWAYDPHLGKELSSAPFSYYADDYARGHQLPSADRLCCKEANSQTFYGTNIAPQLNEHNEGIWSNLENYVRTKVAAVSDTTYVVTGCVVEGSQEFTTDSDKKTMTVPVAFYKALLRYQKGGDPEWAAAGFYTEHKNYGSAKNDLKAISMSIDERETLPGHDFFVNLEGKIGKEAAASIEATDPSPVSIFNLK